LVQNNVIVDATDGGIVIFGAPFSTIRNNTIGVKTRTTLGGINREHHAV
jgi:parallel beta-helix repeat protein